MDINTDLLYQRILQDLAEGVMVLTLSGRIGTMNPAAEKILGCSLEQTKGMSTVKVFFKYSENDAFNQAMLDAVYDPESKHHRLVPYYTGSETRQLHMMTSLLRDGDEPVGVIVVFGDITELAELKIQYAQQITALLDSLVTALSTAIDERSPYTANHTRNMVKMGEAFLDWLDDTANPHRFDEDRRHAFLMSVWLHDVGKLAVPLSIMDKATRLSYRLERIETRFEKIQLLNRIKFLEGGIPQEEYESRKALYENWLKQLQRINTASFLTEKDETLIREIEKATYVDAEGTTQPILTPKEVEDLLIRKGTLTNEERMIMQGHASATRRILSSVKFPEAFSMVPDWASEHHEFLSGAGYPLKKHDGEIPPEVRLLTILDIFEALTAKDRPYKKPIPIEKSFDIMRSMVREGNLDGEILALFEKSKAWEAVL